MATWNAEHLKTWHQKLVDSQTQNLERNRQVTKLPDNVNNYEIFIQRLLTQTKQISQMIARSWYGDDKGNAIRDILLGTKAKTREEAERDLNDLLVGKKQDADGEPLVPQIFNQAELELYAITINWDSFLGELTEDIGAVVNNEPPFFHLILPYPPKPTEFNVTQQELQEWVNSQGCDEQGIPTKPFPTSPYIPLSTC